MPIERCEKLSSRSAPLGADRPGGTGAEHAQARQYGDAVLHLSLAVEQAPQLAPARLQLGLLWLTLKAPGHSASILAPLLSAPETDPLRHFAQGIVALGRLNEENVLVADEVLAKHDENYMPPEVAQAMDKAIQAKAESAQ